MAAAIIGGAIAGAIGGLIAGGGMSIGFQFMDKGIDIGSYDWKKIGMDALLGAATGALLGGLGGALGKITGGAKGIADSTTGLSKVAANVDKLSKGLSNSQRAYKSAYQGVKFLAQHLKHYSASIDLMVTKATFNVVKAVIWTTVQSLQFALDTEIRKIIVGDM